MIAHAHHPEPCPRCAELEERIAFLESELGLTKDATLLAEIRTRFGLTAGEATLLQVLYQSPAGRVARNWTLLEQLPPKEGGPDRGLKIVDVYICKLRKSIGKDAIETVWGEGYRLTPDARLKLSALLKPEAAPSTEDGSLMDAIVQHEQGR